MTARLLRLSFVAIAAAGTFALTGCGGLSAASATDSSTTAASSDTSSSAAAAAPAPTASGLSDPCSLLTSAEVGSLTGRTVKQIDQDGLDPTAATRHCQWQLDDGDLAVFLSTTTEADFQVRDPAATDVSGIGDEAYTSSGHLFVRSGDKQLDVYSTASDNEAGDLAIEKATALKLVPKL